MVWSGAWSGCNRLYIRAEGGEDVKINAGVTRSIGNTKAASSGITEALVYSAKRFTK